MRRLLFLFVLCAGLLASRSGFAQDPPCPPDNVPYPVPGSHWVGAGWSTANLGGGCTVVFWRCVRNDENGNPQYTIGAIKSISAPCFPSTPVSNVIAKDLLLDILNRC